MTPPASRRSPVRPGTEFGGAQTPFTSTTFYPARMWAASYFGELSGGSTNLVVTPAQHRVDAIGDATAIRRLFSTLDLQLFYATTMTTIAALATAPAISDVSATIDGDIVTFGARVHGTDHLGCRQPQVGVADLHLRRERPCSCWQSIELAPSDQDDSDLDGRRWTSARSDPDDLRFIVQAANGAALVGINDNAGAFHSLASTAAGSRRRPRSSSRTRRRPRRRTAPRSTVSATLTEGGTPLKARS